MSSKRWSYKVGETHSGDRVRVYERAGSANLYIATWDPTIEGYRRRSLEHADRDRAKAQAEEASRELREARERADAGVVRRGPATLAECVQEYMALKSPQHVEREQAADKRRAELWIRFAGDRTAVKLSNREWDRFVIERTSGAIDARGRPVAEGKRRPVREATARADMLWLRWVLNWCCSTNREDGSRLLETNPVPEPKSSTMPDRERNAKRPVMSASTFDALLPAAEGMARDLLVIANGTGRRISAICALRWADVDLEQRPEAPYGSIRWPEDTDKEGRATTVEIDPDVRRVLLRRRAAADDGGPIFPARKSEGSISRHYADSLLRKTAEAAGVELRDGEAWHSIRRKWVNDRKHLPPKDVAEAGGWSNVETMMRVYTQTDSETRLSVVLNGRDWTQSTGHSIEEESQEAA